LQLPLSFLLLVLSCQAMRCLAERSHAQPRRD
jgi:hypothetical protein